MSDRRMGKVDYRQKLRKSAGPAPSRSRWTSMAGGRALEQASADRKKALAWIRDDISRSGYLMTIIAIASLAAAIFAGTEDDGRIVVVPVTAAPSQPPDLPAEWRAFPGPKPTIVIS